MQRKQTMNTSGNLGSCEPAYVVVTSNLVAKCLTHPLIFLVYSCQLLFLDLTVFESSLDIEKWWKVKSRWIKYHMPRSLTELCSDNSGDVPWYHRTFIRCHVSPDFNRFFNFQTKHQHWLHIATKLLKLNLSLNYPYICCGCFNSAFLIELWMFEIVSL